MIVILCGKSASGKDTFLDILENKGFERIVSTTSRPMREGEEEGRDYFYVSRDEFEKRIKEGRFVEYRSYDTLVDGKKETWYYGVEKYQQINEETAQTKDFVVVLDLDGAKAFKEAYKYADIVACYLDVNDDERTRRAMLRGSFDETEWNRRLADDNIKFSPENVEAVCDCVMTNNDSSSMTRGMNNLCTGLAEAIADKIKDHKQLADLDLRLRKEDFTKGAELKPMTQFNKSDVDMPKGRTAERKGKE